MQTLIESLNAVAETWAECLWGVLWQSTILILVAGLLAGLFLRRSSPALRYWVWQILAIKLLLMPFWTFAIPLSQMSASRQMEPADEAPLVAVIDDDSTSSSSARNKNSAAAGMPGAAQSSDRPSAIKRVAWQSWLFLGWLAIVSAHVVRLVWQRSRLNRLLRRAIPADERLCELVRETAARLELRHAPPAMFTDVDCSPFVCNMRRAVLVMPRALTARL
ncbi:MAG TPA: hypothetical protein VKU82_13910, partial [Planctomycetaceae bacterium]|nr:hypothetical protein [Planctomycetaceae bacterium]